MKNIVLVGFMGTGKTAVAKALANKLGSEYVSTDDIIEEKEGIAITKIFKEKGEPHFRELEKRVIKEVSDRSDLAIDAGGGVVLFEENIANLRRNGIIICLTAHPDVILERTKHYTHRPLLNVENPEKKIEELLAARAPYYARAADYTIDTSNLKIEEVAEKILAIMKSMR